MSPETGILSYVCSAALPMALVSPPPFCQYGIHTSAMYTERCHTNTWEPLIGSKETHILSKETPSKETPFWFHQKRLVFDQKRPVSHEKRRVFHQKSRMFHKMRLHHVLSKDTCISTKETCTTTPPKETCVPWKETYIPSKETDIPWKETPHVSKETPSHRKTQSHRQQRALNSIKKDLCSIKTDLYSIKRDLQYMERDSSHIQRDTPTAPKFIMRTLVRVRPACGYMYVSVEIYAWLFCGDVGLFCAHLWGPGPPVGTCMWAWKYMHGSFAEI